MTEKPSLKQIPIAAFQFLVLENSTLKEKMRKAVDKSFKIEYNSNEMKVKFGLQANSRDEGRTMINTMGEELNKLMDLFPVKELSTDQTSFRFLLYELKQAKFEFVRRNVHVYCQDEEKFVIVGQEQLVEEIFTKLVGMVSTNTQTSSSSSQTVQLGFDYCNLFGRFKGKDGFQRVFPQVKIEILADSVEIFGPIDQVSQCAEEMKKWPSSIKSGEKQTSKHIIQLLEMQEVRKYVEEYIHGKGIVCVYTTQPQKEMVKIFALSDQVVNLGFTFLHECTMEKKFGCDDYNLVFADPKYDNLHEKYSGKKMIQIDREDCTVLVATDDVMLEFYEISRLVKEREINAMKKSGKNQKEHNTTSIAVREIKLKPPHVSLLKDKDFREKFKQKFPKIEIHEHAEEIENITLVLNGSGKQIESTENDLRDFFKDVGYYESNIDQEVYILIDKKPEIQKYLTKMLQAREIQCYWCYSCDDGKYFIWGQAKDKETAKRGIDIILQSVQVSRLLVVSTITKDINKQIQDIAESNQFSTKAMVFGNKIGEEEIVLVAADDICTEFVSQIHSVIGPKMEVFHIRVEKFFFLKRYCLKDIQKLEEVFYVHVRLDNPPFICISANYENSNNIQLCIAEIKKLSMQKIDVDCIRVQDLEMVRKITDKTAKDFVLSVEEENKCIVSQSESKAEQICTYSILGNDFHVVVIHGRTCDLDVDAIVVPVNECLFPIGYSDDFLKGILY